ncbi:MAG: hypothetical protein JWP74_2819 [Marmoricola sp.]|nr:hypothetical protein [Marmoricola sp.]
MSEILNDTIIVLVLIAGFAALVAWVRRDAFSSGRVPADDHYAALETGRGLSPVDRFLLQDANGERLS